MIQSRTLAIGNIQIKLPPAAVIVDGTAPADLTVTGLAKALPNSWAEQERSIGLLP